MSEDRQTITASRVLAMLADGKTREEIRSFFDLSKGDVGKLFKNPALKGRKTMRKPDFVFEDDVTASVPNSEPTGSFGIPDDAEVDPSPFSDDFGDIPRQ